MSKALRQSGYAWLQKRQIVSSLQGAAEAVAGEEQQSLGDGCNEAERGCWGKALPGAAPVANAFLPKDASQGRLPVQPCVLIVCWTLISL